MKQQFAVYIPGLQAKDYAPIHGSVLKYVKIDEEEILLVLASPNYIREESYFQWVFIQLENNEIVNQETEFTFPDYIRAIFLWGI